MIADILGNIQSLFWNYVIDSLTSWAKLTKLLVLQHWDNISIDFAKENIQNKLIYWPVLVICYICDE